MVISPYAKEFREKIFQLSYQLIYFVIIIMDWDLDKKVRSLI